MPFAPVKSDPWKKPPVRKRRRMVLWPDTFWKSLVERARDDEALYFGRQYPCERWIGPECLRMIREMNERLAD